MSQDSVEVRKELPINWIVPLGMAAPFASNIVVHHTDTEFVINLFELRPPIIVGADAAAEARREAVSALDAICVARVTVGVSKMKSFIDTLSENLSNYERNKSAAKSEAERDE